MGRVGHRRTHQCTAYRLGTVCQAQCVHPVPSLLPTPNASAQPVVAYTQCLAYWLGTVSTAQCLAFWLGTVSTA